jgi:hypothetical protein
MRRQMIWGPPIAPRRMAAFALEALRTVLCSGSYTLVDVRVPSQRLAVRIHLL